MNTDLTKIGRCYRQDVAKINRRIIKDITDFIFLDDKLTKADIIFIPGGSHPELGEGAADVYNKGYAPMVLPSGGVSIKLGKFAGVKSKREIYNQDYTTDCEFLTDVLQINGVPKEAILTEDKSGSTYENAQFSRLVINSNSIKIKKAIICCKSFHARRSLMFYQFAFPDVEFIAHPVRYFSEGVEISADNWYKTKIGIGRVLGELQRSGNQFNDLFVSLADEI